MEDLYSARQEVEVDYSRAPQIGQPFPDGVLFFSESVTR